MMQPVRFSGKQATPPTVQADIFTRLSAKAGEAVFNLPDRFEKKAQELFARRANEVGLRRAILGLGASISGFLGNTVLNYDFHQFHRLGKGRLGRIFLVEPAIGAMVLFLYPFTLLPRLLRAKERGDKNKDYAEVGDVLRRDVLSVTMLMFMLKPVLLAFNSIKQKLDGLKLTERDPNSMGRKLLLSYSLLANYRLDNPEVIKAVLEDGNGKALLRALQGLDDHGLAAVGGDKKLRTLLDEVKQLAPKMIQAHQSGKTQVVDQLAKKIFANLNEADVARQALLESAKASGTPTILKRVKRLQHEYKDVLVHFARGRRLPLDIMALGTVLAVLGFFPVWFNNLWNRKKFQEKLAAERLAAQANFNPQMAYRHFRQSSNLYNAFMQQ